MLIHSSVISGVEQSAHSYPTQCAVGMVWKLWIGTGWCWGTTPRKIPRRYTRRWEPLALSWDCYPNALKWSWMDRPVGSDALAWGLSLEYLITVTAQWLPHQWCHPPAKYSRESRSPRLGSAARPERWRTWRSPARRSPRDHGWIISTSRSCWQHVISKIMWMPTAKSIYLLYTNGKMHRGRVWAYLFMTSHKKDLTRSGAPEWRS